MAKTGERKAQILQTLAAMLENPKGERITTALLAARLEVSEAALYRHFSSKAQMFEGLIEFIESTLFSLVNKITTDTTDGVAQATQIAQAGGGWTGDPSAEANALLAYVLGRWLLFAKSGFKRLPQEHWETQRKFLFG